MSLQQRIHSDLTAAMKARDRQRVSALRMIVAEIKNAAVDARVGAQGQLPDDVVEQLLQREVKRRREAAQTYRDAGRQERAAAEAAEADIYREYLPEPLSDEELRTLVDAAIAEVGAETSRDIGKVMGVVMPQVGTRAQGARVTTIVRSRLSG